MNASDHDMQSSDTHDTLRSIQMDSQFFVERISVVLTYFILGAVNVSGMLVAILVLVVLWVARKTKVV